MNVIEEVYDPDGTLDKDFKKTSAQVGEIDPVIEQLTMFQGNTGGFSFNTNFDNDYFTDYNDEF